MSLSLTAPPACSATAVKSSVSGEGYDKIEDSVNLHHLMKLMSIFESADENGSDGLDLEEFQHAFKEILGTNKSDKQLKSMFMKVDTNCDGTVDWDEFCTYMLLEYQEKDSMNNYDGEMPFLNTIKKVSHSPHRDLLSRISFYHHKTSRYQDTDVGVCNASPSDGRFVTYSKEGAVAFWDTKMSLLKSYHIDTSRLKQLWVLDAIYMQNTGKVITSTTDGEINFYELGSQACERHIRIVGLPFNPITIDYWCDSPSGHSGVLIFGDTDGGVGTICFNNLHNGIFGLQTGNKQVSCHKLNWFDLLQARYDDCVVHYSPQLHKEWTRKVQYCAKLNCFVSCSTDTNTALILSDVDRRRKTNVFKVNKGVNSFEYSSQWNVIVTGGLDRLLRMWNPYVTTTPTASLRGHESAILHLVINNSDGQIVSLSKDNLIKVWDIQSHGCIQTISCQKGTEPALHPPTALCLHDKRNVLLLGAYQLLMLENETKSPNAYSEAVTHHSPLCTALYNENFNQIVCGCMGSVISVWDVETGEKIIQFSKVHGDREITSMTFDPSGRRLLTGGRDGKVKIWNFNNGACLSEIDMGDTAEITSLLMIGEKIVTAGWNRKFGFTRDTKETRTTVDQFFGVGVHQEDILCSTLLPPNVIASGSYKGEIFLWNIDTHKLLKRMYSSMGEVEDTGDISHSTISSRDPNRLDSCLPYISSTERLNILSQCSNTDPTDTSGASIVPVDADNGPVIKLNRKRRMSKWDGFNTGTASLGYLNADYTNSVEKLLFLATRCHTDSETGSLVSAGARGMIQFWNITLGELISQFSAFTDEHTQETVYGLTSNRDSSTLYTGDSRGYVRAWNIREYGFRKSNSKRQPVCLLSIRCHLEAIVSIEYLKDKCLLLTASTDSRARLWTDVGRFIGTFGEKISWRINPSTNLQTLPKKIPAEIQRCGSSNTIDTMIGPVQTKWRMYKSLLKVKALWTVTGNRKKSERFHGLLGKLTNDSISERDILPLEEDLTKLLSNFLKPKLYRPRHNQGVIVRPQDIEISSVYSKLITPALDDSVYQTGVVKSKHKSKQVEVITNTKEERKQIICDVRDVFGVISDLKQNLDLSG